MNSNLIFARAATDDVGRIMEIICAAQEQMRRAGSAQWQNGYPAEADILRDISEGWGYVLRDGATVAAYGAVVFTGEEAYNDLRGEWLTAGGYVVLHRLAVADTLKRRGLAAEYFRRVMALARGRGVPAFRVDTNFDNRIMLHLLERLGFTYCGKVFYASGGERLAYELVLKE